MSYKVSATKLYRKTGKKARQKALSIFFSTTIFVYQQVIQNLSIFLSLLFLVVSMVLFPIFVAMKRILSIGLLAFLVVAACTRHGNDYLLPADVQDSEYTMLIDSMESVLDSFKYHDFSDSLLQPALAYYQKSERPRDYWMQARCHYLLGCIGYGKKPVSQEATTHFLETLHILDGHFDARQPTVGQLYSKTCRLISRVAFNFSDERCSKRFARMGLDYATVVGDTSWMALCCANLGLLYERYGKAGEGDTAYYYCDEGLRLVDDQRYPFETAILCNALANSHRHSHEYDTALYFFGYATSLLDSTVELYHKNYIEEAFVYYRMGDYASAIRDLEEGFRSKRETYRVQAAYGLSDCYEEIGDTLKATPYSSLVKKDREEEVVSLNHNAETMSTLNAYLKEKEPQNGGKTLLWVLAFFVTAAVFVVYHRVYRKRMTQKHEAIQRDLQEAHGALEAQANEALRMKVRAIYDDKWNNTFGRILEVFNTAYPDALAKLKAAHPDLNETELDISVLSFFPFRMKEIADILDLRENTVSKYRTAIKKKTQTEVFEALWEPFLD